MNFITRFFQILVAVAVTLMMGCSDGFGPDTPSGPDVSFEVDMGFDTDSDDPSTADVLPDGAGSPDVASDGAVPVDDALSDGDVLRNDPVTDENIRSDDPSLEDRVEDSRSDGVDVSAPSWPEGSTLVASEVSATSVVLTWPAAQDDVGVTYYRIFQDGINQATIVSSELSYEATDLLPETEYVFGVEASDAEGNWSIDGPQTTVTTRRPSPPDPSDVAPPLNPTVPSNVNDTVSFLYTGFDPIQTGVDPEEISPGRVAVLRGLVLDRDGTPLPGATISILNHPEYGSTQSRDDGMFDMVVNGGQFLSVRYQADGYLEAQRQAEHAGDVGL